MKNFIQDGDTLTLVAPYALTAGQGLLDGATFGVAVNDAANGASVETRIEGVYRLTKAAGVAVTRGTLAYWDNAARVVTNVSAGNTKIGVFAASAVGGAATADVRLNGAF